MSAAVKLSRRSAETLLRAVETGDVAANAGGAVDELRRALAKPPKKYRPLRIGEIGPGDTLEFTDGEYAGQRVTVDHVSEMGLSAHVDGMLVGADGARVFFGGIVPLVSMALAKKAKPKSSQVRKREARNRAKAKETKGIRAEVAARAGGICEVCGFAFTPFNRDELDHFFGRSKVAQSVESTWLLCSRCHKWKTLNQPSALHWLGVFRNHCQHYGYIDAARRAEARMDFERAKRGGE